MTGFSEARSGVSSARLRSLVGLIWVSGVSESVGFALRKALGNLMGLCCFRCFLGAISGVFGFL